MLGALIGACVTALIAAALFARHAPRHVLDIPTARSSHSQPTPRGGGIAIVVGFLVGLGLWLAQNNTLSPRAIGWLVGAMLIAAIGLVDDLRSLPALPRLLVQLAAAALLTVAGVQEREATLAVALPVAFLYVVGLTNMYNFMDGIDGLATSQAIVAGAGLATAGLLIGNPLLSIGGALLAAAALGFLPYNSPPARMFMGDVGSTFLGFSFAGLSLLGTIGVGGGRLPIEFGPVLLAPFFFDGSFTLLRRVLAGERWYVAHRSHLYQRLVQRGWSHGRVTSLYAGGAVLAALAAIGGVLTDERVRLLLAIGAYAPMLLVVGLVWRAESSRRHTEQPKDTPTVVTQGHS